jgi:hypothetical protein
LALAEEALEDAHKALTDPDYFGEGEHGDPGFAAWEERVEAWRIQLARAQAVAISALQAMVWAANAEDVSRPRRRPKRT